VNTEQSLLSNRSMALITPGYHRQSGRRHAY